MSRLCFHALHCTLAGGLLILMNTAAMAQTFDDAGIVRVTDNAEALEPTPEGVSTEGTNCPHCPSGGTMTYSGMPAQGCPVGCPTYGCYGHCYHVARILDWFNPHGMYTHSPDHGFAPPVKRPIYRAPVTYQKGFANQWTGAPTGPQVRVSSVYMPTDTTQLGYYYQHVPYWLPQPNAIPPAPQPSQWHVSLCQVPFYGHHPAGIVFGTAPTATPIPPQAGMVPPAPENGEANPTEAGAPASGLERSAANPDLVPIE